MWSSFHLRFEPVGHPLSVHVYFYDDHFQGYLVRQEVRVPSLAARETLEVWAVPQATLIMETNLKEFERLKNLEVRDGLLLIRSLKAENCCRCRFLCRSDKSWSKSGRNCSVIS